jgi:RNA polymerase sigma-70 factor (ECF subfamily)
MTRLSPDGFADAFEQAARPLWCIAAGVLGYREEVNDVLQEAAIVALGKLDQFDARTNFLAWMGRIVTYTALNHARRVKKQAMAAEQELLQSVADAPTADSLPITAQGQVAVEQRVFDDHVVDALQKLQDIARACLLLRTVGDMSYRDIALALDIPEGTAMSHVHRARRLMRDDLTAAGYAAPSLVQGEST